MINNIRKIINKYQWWAVSAIVLITGIFFIYFTYEDQRSLGDPATFLSFACNISDGDIIYKDFIHFRTPGQYFLNSIFTSIFGCNLKSLGLFLSFEQYILSPIILLIASRLFLGNKKALYGLLFVASFFIFPIASQTRIALAFLSVSLFTLFLNKKNKLNKNKILELTGFTTGICFIFGQDLAIMVMFAILMIIVLKTIDGREIKEKIFWVIRLIKGGIIALLPLIIYSIVYGSFGNMLYYTLYYSFMIQPNGMDLPFPALNYDNFIYFIPYLVYISLYFIILNIKNDKNKYIQYMFFLIFFILRFISASGRSDMGHLYFSIFPDLFIAIYFIFEAVKKYKITINKRNTWFIISNVVIFSALFWAAVYCKSLIFFILSLFILLSVFIYRNENERKHNNDKDRNIKNHLKNYIISVTAITLFIISPNIIDVSKTQIKNIIGRRKTVETSSEIQNFYKLSDKIYSKNPNYIFSFPIHPIYYTIGAKHATPFMTFEPQTTDEEQDKTIEYLKKNQPEVIIFDPLQSISMNKSISKITNFIMNNYEINEVINNEEILWMMVPRDEKNNLIIPSFNLSSMNENGGLIGVENPVKNIHFGLEQNSNSEEIINIPSGYNQFEFEIEVDGLDIEVEFDDGTQEKINFIPKGKFVFNENKNISKIKFLNNKQNIIYNNFVIRHKEK